MKIKSLQHIQLFLFFCLSYSASGQFFTTYPIRKMKPDSNIFTNTLVQTSNGKIFICNLSSPFFGPNPKFGVSEVSDNGFLQNDTSSILDGSIINSVNSLAYHAKDSSYWTTQNGFSSNPTSGLYRYKNRKWTFIPKDSILGWPKQVANQPILRIESVSNDPNPDVLLLFGFYDLESNEIFEFYPLERRLKSIYKIQGNRNSYFKQHPILSNGTMLIHGYPEFVLEKNGNTIKEIPNSAFGFNFKYIYDIKTRDEKTYWISASNGFIGGVASRVRDGKVQTLAELAGINNPPSGYNIQIEKKGGKVWYSYLDGFGYYSERKGTKEFLRFDYDFWGVGFTGGVAMTIGFEIDSNNVKWLLTENNLVKIEDVKTSILNQKPTVYACSSPNLVLKQRTITFGEGIEQYKWKISDGREVFGDSVKIAFQIPGKYEIVLTALDSNSSKAKDTIDIEVLPFPKVQVLASLADTIKTCTFPVTLKAAPNKAFSSFSWKAEIGDLGKDSLYKANNVGKYILTIDYRIGVSSCPVSDSIFVKQKSLSGLVINATIGNKETFNSPGKYSINAIPPIAVQFELDDALVVDKNIDYQLEVQNKTIPKKAPKLFDYQAELGQFQVKAFGYSKDSCYVEAGMEFEFLPIRLLIPNLVTQNGDKKNDTFFIKGLEDYREAGAKLEIEIFNRWGKQVFASQDYKNDWPEDKELVTGNFFYHIKPSFGNEIKGWVQLEK